MDRRLGRIVEDNGSQSPEGSLVDAFYNGGIANITKGSDYFVNEKEVVYTSADFTKANPGQTPATVTAATYKPAAPGCTYLESTGRAPRAISLMESQLKVQPPTPSLLIALATLYERNGNNSRAREYRERAHALVSKSN